MNACAFIGKKCSILNRNSCIGCSFKKSYDELEQGRLKARARLESLPPGERLAIKQKYYLKELKADGTERMEL